MAHRWEIKVTSRLSGTGEITVFHNEEHFDDFTLWKDKKGWTVTHTASKERNVFKTKKQCIEYVTNIYQK